MTCRNCSTTTTDNFCSHCGRPVKLARVDWHYIVHDIQHVLHFEKGILYTVRELLRRPGPSIHKFITTDRSRLVKPVLFLVVTSLIYTTIEHLVQIEQGYVHYEATKSSTLSFIFQWVQNHYGYANIIMGVFIAFWLKLIFRKSNYNFFEILIMLCFLMGVGMLILSLFALVQGLTEIQTLKVSSVVVLCYCTWAIGHFFDRERVASSFKALASYVLGMLTFSITLILLVLLLDFTMGKLS